MLIHTLLEPCTDKEERDLAVNKALDLSFLLQKRLITYKSALVYNRPGSDLGLELHVDSK